MNNKDYHDYCCYQEYVAEQEYNDYLNSLDDKIEEWHNDIETSIPLHEYLDMTWEEYCKWFEND
jgi:hypothetical protein